MTIVRAAGGLLWREGPSGPRLAVVHRPRRDDWSLPKGKLDDGESWEAAALREVEEETACEGRIVGFAGAVSYLAKRSPKIVLYWHMALVREGRFEANDEIDEVAWLAQDAALRRLDYEADRRLVLRSPPGGDRAPPSGPRAPSVTAARADVMRRVLALGADADASSSLGPALELLDHADEALARGDEPGGRSLLLAARRLTVLAAEPPERAALAKALREEAHRLAPWRRKIIRKVVPAGEKVSAEALYYATAVRDEEDERGGVPAARASAPAALALAGGVVLISATAVSVGRGGTFLVGAVAGLAGGAVAAGASLAWSAWRDSRSRRR